MHKNNNPVSRQNDLIMQEFVDEILVYDLLVDKAYCLNNTSMLIWHLCDGTKTVNEIAIALSKQVGSGISDDLVWVAIDQFRKDELLEDNELNVQSNSGMSRRTVIKKVGMASAIALPLISSITAPLAAHAGSCLPNGSPCQFQIPPFCCNICIDPTASNIRGNSGICTGNPK